MTVSTPFRRLKMHSSFLHIAIRKYNKLGQACFFLWFGWGMTELLFKHYLLKETTAIDLFWGIPGTKRQYVVSARKSKKKTHPRNDENFWYFIQFSKFVMECYNVFNRQPIKTIATRCIRKITYKQQKIFL